MVTCSWKTDVPSRQFSFGRPSYHVKVNARDWRGRIHPYWMDSPQLLSSGSYRARFPMIVSAWWASAEFCLLLAKRGPSESLRFIGRMRMQLIGCCCDSHTRFCVTAGCNVLVLPGEIRHYQSRQYSFGIDVMDGRASNENAVVLCSRRTCNKT